jgi:hypothetical protein
VYAFRIHSVAISGLELAPSPYGPYSKWIMASTQLSRFTQSSPLFDGVPADIIWSGRVATAHTDATPEKTWRTPHFTSKTEVVLQTLDFRFFTVNMEPIIPVATHPIVVTLGLYRANCSC